MKKPNSIVLANQLRKNIEIIAAEVRAAKLSASSLKTLNREFAEAARELESLQFKIDPLEQPSSIFDPGNPKTVGFFVALALTAQARSPLDGIPQIHGSGIYAIYYTGRYRHYLPISGSETPIYVGRAASNRSDARTAKEQGPKLKTRLGEHLKTISTATATLSPKHFEVRMLVVQSGWDAAAEEYLIRLFRPIWNKETRIIQGFGKHGDAPQTRQNKVSSWDVLHQGRKAAGHGVNPNQKSEPEIALELKRHFIEFPAYPDISSVLDGFLAELKQR